MPKMSKTAPPDSTVYGLRYHPPQVMPGGWWDSLTSLAEWVETQVKKAYEDGYWAGRLDGYLRRDTDKNLSDDAIGRHLRDFGEKSPS